MIRRPLRPSFDPRNKEDFLTALYRARDFNLKYQSAQDFGSEARHRCEALLQAIDGMAEELTGDRSHFGLKSPSYPSKSEKS